jgi:hypothetical protein
MPNSATRRFGTGLWEFTHINFGSGHIFSFLPQMEEDARSMIPGLLTYLVCHAEDCAAQDSMKLMSTPSAVERASTSTWDSAYHCVVSELDTKIDDVDDNPTNVRFLFTDVAKAVAKVVCGRTPDPNRGH